LYKTTIIQNPKDVKKEEWKKIGYDIPDCEHFGFGRFNLGAVWLEILLNIP
tara:strand:+ start:245 stop:397 length:153 start_codon:yes stop_codon:yes gene_type:complete